MSSSSGIYVKLSGKNLITNIPGKGEVGGLYCKASHHCLSSSLHYQNRGRLDVVSLEFISIFVVVVVVVLDTMIIDC